MSSNDEEFQTSFHPPYSSAHPIPTIQKYREEKDKRRAQAEEHETNPEATSGTALEATENAKASEQDSGRTGAASDANYLKVDGRDDKPALHTNLQDANADAAEDTSQTATSTRKATKIRRLLHLNRNDRAEREVTDPVTHLPTQIHDFTQQDLKEVTKDGYLGPPRSGQGRSRTENDEKVTASDQAHAETLSLFPPPNHEDLKKDVTKALRRSMNILGLLFATAEALLAAWTIHAVKITRADMNATALVITLIAISTCGSILIVKHWAKSKVSEAIDTRIWDTERSQGKEVVQNRMPETSEWLNSTLHSMWPLVNPSIFTNLSDMLEVSSKIFLVSSNPFDASLFRSFAAIRRSTLFKHITCFLLFNHFSMTQKCLKNFKI